MTIAKGDFVVVAHVTHECGRYLLGRPFVVTGLQPQTFGGWFCGICNTPDLMPSEPTCATGLGKALLPLSWLRKIEPPRASQDTSTPRQLDLVRA